MLSVIWRLQYAEIRKYILPVHMIYIMVLYYLLCQYLNRLTNMGEIELNNFGGEWRVCILSKLGQVHGVWGLRRRLPGQVFWDVRRQVLGWTGGLLHRLRQLPGYLSRRRHRDRRRLGRLGGPPRARENPFWNRLLPWDSKYFPGRK